ncbi:MAG TPA: L-glutamate gamma-semialdehyde dehydrogenase [Acidobacteriota bacterium]
MLPDFKNEPFTNFQDSAARAAFAGALQRVRAELGATAELLIGAERIATERSFESTNPSSKSEIVGRIAKGSREHADQAVRAAAAAFESWRRLAPRARAELALRTAAILRRRRHEFSAWMVLEVGKSWPEADGDTAEAIDFCEFYAREALRYASDQPLTAQSGESNQLVYLPLGVVIVIPPWNFPLAIMAGMTIAALVTGNTVVIKPSSDAPMICAQFVAALEAAGAPAGVVNYLPGSGADVGNVLVEHPLTRMIAFTGSKAVGLEINQRAAKLADGQRWIKRVIAEMGGKDAILVAADADLDAAALAVSQSAFGFQGQKCSACSRAIIDQRVYDSFVPLLLEQVEKLSLGPVENPAHNLGPVINAGAQRKILEYIEIGKSEGKLLIGGAPGDDGGYFIQPTVFGDVAPNARISQEEIFGPVLALTRCESFESGLQMVNDTEYGLTGAVFSRSPHLLEWARHDFHVGNLYLNRKCTGAMVGAHPFGGFNMSGTDSKAGGRDYLGLFLQAKAISLKL